MTDLLLLAGLLLIAAPLVLVSLWAYLPAAGVLCILVAAVRMAGEAEPKDQT